MGSLGDEGTVCSASSTKSEGQGRLSLVCHDDLLQQRFIPQARLIQGGLLKKVLDATKDLVTDANFDCSQDGFNLQVSLPY